MVKEIFNFLMIAGIIIGVVFIGFTMRSKHRKVASMQYLCLVVLFLSFNNLQITLVDNGYLEVNFFVRKLLIPWYLLIMPFFYAFLISYLKEDGHYFSFLKIAIGIFVFEIAVRLCFLPYFYQDTENYTVARYAQFEEIFNALFSLFLFVKSALLVFSFSQYTDYITSLDKLLWLKTFIFLGCFVMLMWVCAIFINIDNVVYPEIMVYYPMRLSCSIILYWLAYHGFFKYDIMAGILIIKQTDLIEEKSEFLDQKLWGEKPEEVVVREKFMLIEEAMKNHEYYLSSDFSLIRLSELTNIPVNKISYIINNCTEFNFSDYVNSYRVQKVKEYLQQPESLNLNIMAFGYQCGFNSKSAFYSAFRKFTGLTPMQFRKDFFS